MEHNKKKCVELVNKAIREFMLIYRAAIKRSGIAENEFRIWYTLIVMGEDYSQQDICDMWSMPKQTVNSIISRMVQMNYVDLECVGKNRKAIRLTQSGKKYGELVALPISNAEQRAFVTLPIKDQEFFIGSLSKYVAVMRREIYERAE